MKSIRHLFGVFSTQWTADPAARGAAKMTAGALLVAEGLFGALGDLMPDGISNKRSGGILRSLLGMIVGGIFIAASLWMKPATYPDAIRTRGTIAAVESSRGSDRKVMYQPTYSFQADGKEYRFTPAIRTNIRPAIGGSVDIAYSKSDPNKAHRTDGIASNLHWVLGGSGALVFLGCLIRGLISLVMIGFGLWLFLGGRKDRKSSGSGGGFISDLMSFVGGSRSPASMPIPGISQ